MYSMNRLKILLIGLFTIFGKSTQVLTDTHNNVRTLADDDYPPSLLTIADPPPLLYAKGRLDLLTRPAIAIVGSRNATKQGMENAERFAQALSAAGLTVIS